MVVPDRAQFLLNSKYLCKGPVVDPGPELFQHCTLQLERNLLTIDLTSDLCACAQKQFSVRNIFIEMTTT